MNNSLRLMMIIIASCRLGLLPATLAHDQELATNETDYPSSPTNSLGRQASPKPTSGELHSNSQVVSSASSTSSSTANAGDTATSGSETSASFLSIRDSYDAKQEHQLAQQASMAGVELYPNHRNYPIEPYPSASYTSLSVSSTPSSTSHQQMQQINSLLNRDHHDSAQLANINSKLQADYSNLPEQSGSNVSLYMDSFSHHDLQDNSFKQHLSDSIGASNLLHTGLLQNLTASLFPAKQNGSNATLSTLSELLNKTKLNQSSSLPTTVNSYFGASPTSQAKVSANLGSIKGSAYSTYVPSSMTSGQASAFIDSPYSSVLDQLRSSTNSGQFGFRDTRQQGRSEPLSSSGLFVPTTTKLSTGYQLSEHKPLLATGPLTGRYIGDLTNIPQTSGYKTASTLYNTYMPYKDNQLAPQANPNGIQGLNMASLYDNYLVDNGYKFPLVVNNVKSYQQPTDELHKTSASQSVVRNLNQASPNYQYAQQQQSSNSLNQLDKIIYHSTPFRPSIVSPPQSLSEISGSRQQTLIPFNLSNQLGSSSEHKKQTVYSTNGQAINSNRFHKDNSNTRLNSGEPGGDTIDQHATTTTAPSVGTDELEFGHQFSQQSQSLRSHQHNSGSNVSAPPATRHPSYASNTPSSLSTQPPGLVQMNYESDFRAQQSNQTSPATVSPSASPQLTGNSALLFDLYEREIDNQIQEALYGEQHLSTPFMGIIRPTQAAPATLQSSSSSNWFDKVAPSSSNIYEETVNSNLADSWARPVSSSNQAAYMHPIMTGARANRFVGPESLATALQELPNFSTSDLQPLYPSGPSYPLIAAASNQDGISPASLVSALAPHLISGYTSNVGQISDGTLKLSLVDGLIKPSESTTALPISTTTSPSPTTAAPSSSSSVWPTILLKLQSSPLSSLLATPLSHLYSKNKNAKKPNQQQPTSSASQKVNNYSQPTSSSLLQLQPMMNAKHLFGVLGANGDQSLGTASSSHTALSQGHPESTNHRLKSQQVAQLAANLLAAASETTQHQWNPLQVTLAQAISPNPYLASPTEEQDLSALLASLSPGFASSANMHDGNFLTAASGGGLTVNNGESSGPTGSGVLGIAGGGISPLIWRSIFSPASWARKQSGSSSNNIAGYSNTSATVSAPVTSNNSNGQSNQQSPRNLQISSSSSPQLSSIFSSSSLPMQQQQGSHKANENSSSHNQQQLGIKSRINLPLSSLFGSATSHLFGQSANGMNNNPSSSSLLPLINSHVEALRRPLKLKIKILKIPVAVYDQTPATQSHPVASLQAGSSLNSRQTAAIDPMAAASQMHSSLSASLLARMSCPLPHPPEQQLIPHTLEQHLLMQTDNGGGPSLMTNLAQISPLQTSTPSASTVRSSLAGDLGFVMSPPTSTNGGQSVFDGPLSPLQGFTEINQPHDLQESPSSTQTKTTQVKQ